MVYPVQPGPIGGSPAARAARRGPLAVGVVLTLIGAVFGLIGFAVLAGFWRAAKWPTTPGTVLTSRIDSHRGSKGGTSYSLAITYRYQVGNASYVGTRLEPGMRSWGSQSSASADMHSFPPGAACVVHYNPEDPQESALRVEAGSIHYFFAAIGCFLILAGLGGFVAWWFARSAPPF